MNKLGGHTKQELDKARGFDTTKLGNNYIEIKPLEKVQFITIKDVDFGEIRVEKSLIDFLNESTKSYSETFTTCTGIIIDFNEKENENRKRYLDNKIRKKD